MPSTKHKRLKKEIDLRKKVLLFGSKAYSRSKGARAGNVVLILPTRIPCCIDQGV